MRPRLRRSRAQRLPGISGTARLDRRTRSLVKRAQPGDIAIIDHVDIDRGAAMALVDAQVAGVVNLAPSISGRYPNLGPEVLVEAGVVLIDGVEAKVFSTVNEGDVIRIEGDTIYRGDVALSSGHRHDAESVAAALEASRDGMASQLEAFSANVIEHLRREQDVLLDGKGVPPLDTHVDGRQVLIVVRAFDYRSDLRSLKKYIKENSPVLVGVDGGADALIEAGYRPDLVITDGDEISDLALRCGAEVVAVATTDGRVRGADRMDRRGIGYATFVTGGTVEDGAMLVAHAHHAELIVVAGSHSTLVEFLDQGRSAMASSFLTRATVGSRLVHAKAVAPLYQNRIRGSMVLLLLLLALAGVGAAIGTTPVGQDWWDDIWQWTADAVEWGRERLS